jgi:hypothetical protein
MFWCRIDTRPPVVVGFEFGQLFVEFGHWEGFDMRIYEAAAKFETDEAMPKQLSQRRLGLGCRNIASLQKRIATDAIVVTRPAVERGDLGEQSGPS